LEPSIITKYLIEVVNKFNVFYKSYEVLNLEDKSLIKARLTLIDATSRIIKSTLEILGIENVELYD
ncbi:MAG: arginine--tRNA ligase, partial [Clostridium sp.]|nr:arginine--tRNA ligase [Clostridium sp.]